MLAVVKLTGSGCIERGDGVTWLPGVSVFLFIYFSHPHSNILWVVNRGYFWVNVCARYDNYYHGEFSIMSHSEAQVFDTEGW